MKKVLCGLISMYQKSARLLNKSSCRFYPSCSEYMKQAIVRYGIKKGIGMGIWRILRCQQFCSGGYDPII